MRLDILITDSLYPPFVGETALAIYRFDGDTLILASSEPGVAEAPTGIIPIGGTRVWELENEESRSTFSAGSRQPRPPGAARWAAPFPPRLASLSDAALEISGRTHASSSLLPICGRFDSLSGLN
jgi:hypothetical protein